MNDVFAQRVRSAAVAGWWTVVVGAIWLTVAWLIALPILRAQPGWLLTLWGSREGGELTWKQVNSLMLTFMAVFKLILFTGLLLSLWLTLWSRRLKRLAPA